MKKLWSKEAELHGQFYDFPVISFPWTHRVSPLVSHDETGYPKMRERVP
jgi:hypothetical protein